MLANSFLSSNLTKKAAKQTNKQKKSGFFYSLCFCWQRQIGHNIKFGQRLPSLRRSEGDEGSSDEEEVPQSPLRVLAQVENEPPETETKEKVS